MNREDKISDPNKGKDSLLGLAVCLKCNLINKVRSPESLKAGKCICSGCGAEIPIKHKINNI